ncbi:MAG: hypothetical protein ACI9ZT_000072 [Gammaproteobacteria bacterium]|jgi:hypothetical protein
MIEMKESTKEKIDALSIHEFAADFKNARTSPYQGVEKRKYIDERLSLLKSESTSAELQNASEHLADQFSKFSKTPVLHTIAIGVFIGVLVLIVAYIFRPQLGINL